MSPTRAERAPLDLAREERLLPRATHDELPIEAPRRWSWPIPGGVWLRGAGVLLFYTWLAVLLTWPLAPDLATRYSAHIDPPFSAWRLARVAHQLEHDPWNLFDGEIFWPARRTLAYSDAMLVQGVLAIPWLKAGTPPIAVSNLFTLAGMVASAGAAYVLARRLTGHTGAALLAGLVFAFSPYRRDHLVHLELQWAQWIPLALWAWHRALDGGRLRDGLLCAAFVLLQLLSSIYYAAFLAVACLVVGSTTLAARRFRLGRRAAAGLVVGGLAVAVAASLYGAPYAQVKERLGERTLEETTRYSATPLSYLSATKDNWLYGGLTGRLGDDETHLFPGLTPVVLAVVALPPASMVTAAYGLCAVVGWDASLGMNGRLFPVLRSIEAFRGLRVPARFAVIVQLALGVLAAFGLARIARRWPASANLVVTTALMLTVVEYVATPYPQHWLPKEAPPVYAWMATQPKEVTLELPAPGPQNLPMHDPFYMYAATWHWQPLVNGYSGHYGRAYLDLVETLDTLPDEASIAALKRIGVQRILVHEGLYRPRDYERLIARLDAHPLFHLTRVSFDHMSNVRVYVFLPGFGPRDP